MWCLYQQPIIRQDRVAFENLGVYASPRQHSSNTAVAPLPIHVAAYAAAVDAPCPQVHFWRLHYQVSGCLCAEPSKM